MSSVHLLFASLLVAPAVQQPKNVVIILADDMGLPSLHAENPNSGLPTPHLDRLAEQGMSFTDAHAPSAVCSPTRYGLLTGRYPWRTTMKAGIVNKWGPPIISEGQTTLADVAHSAGLTSACIGKWHLGWLWPNKEGGHTSNPSEIDYTKPLGGGPLAAGFEHSFGDDVPNWPPYLWIENNQPLSIPSDVMEDEPVPGVRPGPMTPGWSLEAVLPELTRRCVAFIRDCAKEQKPFFLFYPMTSPHTPITPSEGFLGQSGVSTYADFILETDWSVGQLLRALDQYGIADETLVIFTADNGTSPKGDFSSLEAGGVDLRANLRGHKADIWEGGHRVPFLVRWPGVIEAGSSCEEPIILTDLLPTIAHALGVELPKDAGNDGINLTPLFQGNAEHENPRTLVMQSSQGYFAVRAGPWKACFSRGSGGWSAPSESDAKKNGLPKAQLFHLGNDPEERNNLAKDQPGRLEELRKLLKEEVERAPLDSSGWWNRLPWPKPQ